MLSYQQLEKIYTPEQLLLVIMARLHLGTAMPAEVEELLARQNVDWNKVISLARVHGVTSFLYTIIAAGQLNVPPDVLATLKNKYQRTKIKNLEQVQMISQLTELLHREGITAIPYKGALFAAAYYADWAARESQDIDFLVAPQDVPAVEQILIREGYQPVITVPPRYLPYYIRHFKDMVYRKPATRSAVEIHWRLMERFSGDYPGHSFFLQGLIPYRNGSFSTHRLSPLYDFLAVASNHFVKDLSIKFKYLIDMAVLMKQEKEHLDENAIDACALQYGFQKRLLTGLQLVDDILGIGFKPSFSKPLPAAILQAPLADKLTLERLYINHAGFLCRSWHGQDSAWKKTQFMLRCLPYVFLPTHADINSLKWPPVTLPLLFVARPFRLAYKAVVNRKSK